MHPFTKPLYQPSTFLQSVLPPVFMSDDDPYSYGFDDGFDDDDDDDDDTISVSGPDWKGFGFFSGICFFKDIFKVVC